MTITLEPPSVEAFRTAVEASADPTATAPGWAIVACGVEPSAFTPGSWAGVYANGSAVAVTPTVGFTGSGAGIELAAGDWQSWVRITVGGEVIVRRCDLITVK
jgi:hypothetical protein